MNKTVEVLNVTLTKRAKLLRFAQIIRERHVGWFKGKPLHLFSNIEHEPDRVLANLVHPESPFAVAYADRDLRIAGLAGESVLEGKRFFELTTDELHRFSCDCGGEITNEEMADRIEAIAA